MKLNIQLDENELRALVLSHLQDNLGSLDLTLNDIEIEVKSAHNYKSEWERAEFRATVKRG